MAKDESRRDRWVKASQRLRNAFQMAAVSCYMMVLFAQPAAAADTMWTRFSTIIADVYGELVGISTIVAVTAAAVALLVRMISRNERAVAEATSWLKRIVVTWIVLNIYIQQYLYPALRRYFDGKPPACYRSCVLAYRHVYQRGRPERAYRDHDNIEVNMVTDIITLYLLPDDAPRRCAHYYCSTAGEVDCTEVYVVPASRFPEWLAAEQADDLKEDTLYETSEIWA